MYIALKWLIALGFILWASLCFLDSQIKIKKYQHELLKGLDKNLLNKGATLVRKLNYPFSHTILAVATVTTFLLVAIFKHYNSKPLEEEKPSGFLGWILDVFLSVLEVFKIRNFILNVKYYAGKILQISSNPAKMADCSCNTQFFVPHSGELSQKLLEVNRENKHLKKLINSTLSENRKVYKAFKLECAEREKLSEQINFMQIQMKEKTALFQKHHFKLKNENKSLREEIRRLSFSTNESEMKLRRLIREIFRSKNKQLKAFCDNMMLNKDLSKSKRTKDFCFKDLCSVSSVSSLELGTLLSEKPDTVYEDNAKLPEVDIALINPNRTFNCSLTNLEPIKLAVELNSSIASTPSWSLLKSPSEKKLVTGSTAFKDFLCFGLRTTNINS